MSVILLSGTSGKLCEGDTVCIDKTSSSELTQAINSMFAWYADFEVMYRVLV